jgi:hypothetical protein
MNKTKDNKYPVQINGRVTIQFWDGDERKIIKGDVVEDKEGHIVVECEHTKYWLNKNKVDWIKFDTI